MQSMASPIPAFALTYAAVYGGNLTGNGKALIHHSFGIFWCGSGFAQQGYTNLSPNPCSQSGDGSEWGYYPKALGISALSDYSAHSDWVGIVESNAIHAFQSAFSNFPLVVGLAGQSPFCPILSFCTATTTPDQDYTVYVVGDYPFGSAGQFFSDSASKVFYFSVMEGSQEALGRPPSCPDCGGWSDYSPSYPPADTQGFVNLLKAMGTGIGNAAAHEIGHHLERITNISSNDDTGFPFMDCGLGDINDPNRGFGPIDCENGDDFVYGFYSESGFPHYADDSMDSGGMFFYGVAGGTPGIPAQKRVHWGPSEVCWLHNYVSAGSCNYH